MGHKAPWKIGILTVSLQLFVLQQDAVLSPYNFGTTHSTAYILMLHLLANSAADDMEHPFLATYTAEKIREI